MVKRDTPNIQIKVRTLNETIYLCSAFFLLVFSHKVWNYVRRKKEQKILEEKKKRKEAKHFIIYISNVLEYVLIYNSNILDMHLYTIIV